MALCRSPSGSPRPSDDSREKFLRPRVSRSDVTIRPPAAYILQHTRGVPATEWDVDRFLRTVPDAPRRRAPVRTVAMVFTLLPLTFVFHGTTITFFLIRDAPIIGITWWLTAAIMWIWHVRIRRRLRVCGL